jgi:GNAT superfamily N-acetyltransferase
MLPRPDTGGLEFLPGPQGVILNVYTEPSWRRRWLAAALMQRILDWAAANGVKSLVLHPSADGRPPYEKPGFERTNEMRYMGNRR